MPVVYPGATSTEIAKAEADALEDREHAAWLVRNPEAAEVMRLFDEALDSIAERSERILNSSVAGFIKEIRGLQLEKRDLLLHKEKNND